MTNNTQIKHVISLVIIDMKPGTNTTHHYYTNKLANKSAHLSKNNNNKIIYPKQQHLVDM